MAPILLHDMPEPPRWNLYLLFVLWATQVFSTCLSELYTLVGLFSIVFGGPNSPSLQISLFAVMLLNLPFFVVAVPYEVYQYRTRQLTTSKYFNCQIIKTAWVVLASIPLLFMLPTLGFFFLFLVCALPFIGALIYAKRIHHEFTRDGDICGGLCYGTPCVKHNAILPSESELLV